MTREIKIKQTFLITGGDRGLGQVIAECFDGVSISRQTGFDITKNINDIAEQSLKYDVFVNNAFDGPPHEPWANFGQANVYMAVYDAWKAAGKSGYIFNIGSIGNLSIVSPEPRFETYRVAKAALEHASCQGTQAFKQNHVKFKTTLINTDRLDTELSRSRSTWTGNGISCYEVANFITYALLTGNNTCIQDISFYCNLNFQA
jgi:NADP-dependent 3-hydroxy acid dehydrogenase YdfG